jgi:hypothetical protein
MPWTCVASRYEHYLSSIHERKRGLTDYVTIEYLSISLMIRLL